jgi:ABC-type antimicrobial peptide transport system permease subunit
LLSIRAALVFTLALLTGIGAGVLSAVGGSPPTQCVLYGAGAFGLSVPFFDCLIAGTGPNDP